MVRRVMHMIREEWDQDLDEHAVAGPEHDSQQRATPPEAAAAAGKPSERQGLLSKALRPLPMSRALSLHNLLDQAALAELHAQLATANAPANPQMTNLLTASRVRKIYTKAKPCTWNPKAKALCVLRECADC